MLGTYALRLAGTRRLRIVTYIAALLVFLFIASVAWAHDPRGVFVLLSWKCCCKMPCRSAIDL